MERIRKHRDFLQRLVRLGKDRRKRSREVGRASQGELCAVCELVKNLLHNPHLNIQLDEQQRKVLRRHRRALKELISRRVSGDRKRRILQRGAGGFLLPLVLGLVGPIVSKLFSGGSSSR